MSRSSRLGLVPVVGLPAQKDQTGGPGLGPGWWSWTQAADDSGAQVSQAPGPAGQEPCQAQGTGESWVTAAV